MKGLWIFHLVEIKLKRDNKSKGIKVEQLVKISQVAR